MLLHDWELLDMVREYRGHYECSLQEALKIIHDDLTNLLGRIDKMAAGQEKRTLEVLKAQGMTDEEAVVFLEGIKKGLKARREGKVRPWSEIKRELGL